MEFEFDKEMDAILRRGAAGEALALPDAHPDADEISAFAENAVADAARQRYVAHFADCARCRKILSNVIVLNAEADAEAASSAVPVAPAGEKAPWYRKLFAFPQLAYAMGALVLLFSGFFGYLILRNLPGAGGGADVSYSTNRSAPAIQPATQDSTVGSTANANTASNSTATTTSTNTAIPSLPSTISNTAPPASNATTSTSPSREFSVQPAPAAPAAQSQPMMATP